MTMRTRLIISSLLFPLLTIFFLSVSPIRLITEPGLELVAHIVPVPADGESSTAQTAVSWLRVPDAAFSGTARTAEAVVVFDAMQAESAALGNFSVVDLTDAGAVTVLNGTPTVLRAGHTPRTVPAATAAVLRGDEVFSIDSDGAGFGWEDPPLAGTRIRLAGPVIAVETVSGSLWAADAFGFVYLLDGTAADSPGNVVAVRHPESESYAAAYALAVHPAGRVAVLEGLHPTRLSILYRSGNSIATSNRQEIETGLNRPHHLAWAGDTVLFETEDGFGAYDTARGQVQTHSVAGRIVGFRWHEALDLILVLVDGYQSNGYSRLHIFYADDMQELATLEFRSPVYSITHEGNHVFIGLETRVVIYELSH